MKIPEPEILKSKRGRIRWKYDFEHYLVRINKFSADEEPYVMIKVTDIGYPSISQGLGSNFFISFSSELYTVNEKESALEKIKEAFELAEYLQNNLEDMCVEESQKMTIID